MTEKRFWLSPIVYDGEQRFVRDKSLIGEKSMSNNEVVDLLNNLSEENEQLQKKNDNLVNMIARVQYRADLIKEENEQLKSYTGEMEDYLARLEEKNEQLKADKQALIDFIRKEFPKSHKHILEGLE